jgi:hypothetical protein
MTKPRVAPGLMCGWPASTFCALQIAALLFSVRAGADEHRTGGTGHGDKFILKLSAVAKAGDMFDVQAVSAILAVVLKETQNQLNSQGRVIGYSRTYIPAVSPSDYWLPPTEYEILSPKPGSRLNRDVPIGVAVARLQFSWGSLGYCVRGSESQRVFGAPRVLPSALPLDGPAQTSTWRWIYPGRHGTSIILDATFFPAYSDCIIAFGASETRKAELR